MNRIVPILFITLCAASAVLSSDNLPHYVGLKSFDDAFRECGRYFLVSDCDLDRYYKEGFPDTHKVKQLIRCTLFNLNAYTDETGPLEHVLGNFFKPCPKDSDYAERTRACVKKALDQTCPDDVYTRPYASFRCYYNGYGNIVSEKQFNPNTMLEAWQLQLFAQSILNLPYEVVVKYSEGCILDEPHFPHVLYVWAVRGGYYKLHGGIQLDRLYTQFGLPQLLSKETSQSVADVAQKYCNADIVTLVYYTFMDCIHPFLPFEKLVQEAAKQQLSCGASKSSPSSGYSGYQGYK